MATKEFSKLGINVHGIGEDGELLIEICGWRLRAYSDAFSSTPASELEILLIPSAAPQSDLFIEAPDDLDPTACSAVSEFNALVAERPKNVHGALCMLSRLLREAEHAPMQERHTGSDEDGRSEDEGESADDLMAQIEEIAWEQGAPEIHEAAVLPASGEEDDFEAAMDRLITCFAKSLENISASPPGESIAALMLRHCQWDDTEAMRRFRSDPVVFGDEVGVVLQNAADESPGCATRGASKLVWRCGICFEDFHQEGDGFAFACGHLFCNECWKRHLDFMARGGGGGGNRVLDTACPAPDCNILVAYDTYQKLKLTNLANTYRRALLRSFLDSGAVAECPGCARRVLLGTARPDAGPCRQCGRQFCSLCFKEAHGPLTCAEYRTWLKLLVDNSQGVVHKWATRLWNFLSADGDDMARRCPNPECGVMSSKIDGCHFVGCPQCREMWCWNCGEWGGGPSGRPKPHHVFVCTALPADITWLDGHSVLTEDANFSVHLDLWNERTEELEEVKQWSFGTICELAMPTTRTRSTGRAVSGPLVAKEVEDELRAAASEGWHVLCHCAAWRFFSRPDGQRRLFEFAEQDLAKLLSSAKPKSIAQTCLEWQALDGGGLDKRMLSLAAALRSQAQALRSFRQTGGM